MTLSKNDLEELRYIYSKHYGAEISYKQAEKIGQSLIGVISLIIKPIENKSLQVKNNAR